MSKEITQTAMQVLLEQGQSVWLDYLRRGMLRSGELQGLIDDGLRGMTSNPTIFEHAIGGSTDYDDALRTIGSSPKSSLQVFEQLAVEDVREAADLFRPVYDRTEGRDGFVSLEVSPTLARDTEGTIGEAKRLWDEVNRPNVMIKVPGTKEGWPAIQRLLSDGININITLLFSLEHYRQVAIAYMRALEARTRAGHSIDRLASVASFFVSRVDTETDRRIEAGAPSLRDLRGRVAVANAQLAYVWFRDLLRGADWQRLAAAGARPQRLLWASTGTKNPAYSDVLYVDTLIGPDTINTMPPATLQLFEDHGTVRRTLPDDARDATSLMKEVGRWWRGLRRRDPGARGRWNREVRQIVRGAARRDQDQATGAGQADPTQAFGGVPHVRRPDRGSARVHGQCAAFQSASGLATPRSGRATPILRRSATAWAGSSSASRWRSR